MPTALKSCRAASAGAPSTASASPAFNTARRPRFGLTSIATLKHKAAAAWSRPALGWVGAGRSGLLDLRRRLFLAGVGADLGGVGTRGGLLFRPRRFLGRSLRRLSLFGSLGGGFLGGLRR